MVRALRRRRAATPARGGGGRRDRVHLRRQRRRPALGRLRRRRRPGRARAGARSSSTTPPPRPMSRASWPRPAGEQGAHFIDAPVSGGQAGAENGALTIMCGGEAGPVRPRRAGAARLWPGGDADGPGRRRPAHQDGQPDLHRRAAAGAGRGRSTSPQRAGLDPDQVLATISKGAAQSWQMDNRWPTMAAGKFDFGFAVDWMRKDLGDRARRGPAQRRGAAGHGAGRPVLPADPAARRRPPATLRA